MKPAKNNIILSKIILPSFVICHLFIGHYSLAFAKEYDGIWFLGFNHNKKIFQKIEVRKAVAHAIDKNYISLKIMSEEAAAASFIPPGVVGHDASLSPLTYDPAYAKFLLKKSAPKNLSLLHTDGVKTVAIAKRIKADLARVGIKVNLIEVVYKEEGRWEAALAAKKYDLFLMGHKAGLEQVFSTAEAVNQGTDPLNLLSPLFKAGGPANFTGYSNAKVDNLLEQLATLDSSLKKEREAKLREINRVLSQDLPAVVLFYIEKF